MDAWFGLLGAMLTITIALTIVDSAKGLFGRSAR